MLAANGRRFASRAGVPCPQLVLLDQRGTGYSTALTTEWLESEQASGKTEAQLADYVAQFRADAIVRDAKQLRELLGVQRWTALGQSFGGFCCVHL